MEELDKDYSADFIHSKKKAWYEIMSRFEDANLYQTWSYDMVRFGQKKVVHLILKKKDLVVAVAQTRIYRLPVPKIGIAYVLWGPMWRLVGASEEEEVFRQVIRALKNEFSLRRGLVLRLYPLVFRDEGGGLKQILREEGFLIQEDGEVDRTLLMDLKPSLEELRAALHQKWRNCLNRAEKNRLELILGQEEGLFDEITKIYSEMVKRKGLVELSDINHLKMVQRDLPAAFKLLVIICRLNGEPCAGAIFSAIGTTGVYLIGATSNAGLKKNGSYLVQWAFVKWLKENNFRYYDLNGINPNTNPGTYRFKHRLAGKRGRDVEFLGKFQVADSLVSFFSVKLGEWLIAIYRGIEQRVRTFRNSA